MLAVGGGLQGMDSEAGGGREGGLGEGAGPAIRHEGSMSLSASLPWPVSTHTHTHTTFTHTHPQHLGIDQRRLLFLIDLQLPPACEGSCCVWRERWDRDGTDKQQGSSSSLPT